MPERTAEEWAKYIEVAIKAAEDDGHDVWIYNDCCPCSKARLTVGSYEAQAAGEETSDVTW